ncbi:ABC transporter ATP-binding protein [Lachnoclostridium sp. Marseille-P6806]|uniref:ABC transporter ATP-binding protein n=1 Tax=Lachnoclostridium sp. Marseille-P6806 TaxID=2364793 RepID=UPI0010305BBC|nr:ABC transporter ATP-binding protein [Lachnoclostridium sp. Marseille-P6806]
MRRLLKYLKGYEKETVLAPSFKMLEAFFDLLVPLVIARMIDVGLPGRRGYLIGEFFLLLLLAAVGLACSVTAQFFAAKVSVGFAARLRQDLFDHVQSLSGAALDKLGSGTLITRMTSDVNQVQNGLNMTLRLLLRSPFIVFGSMIMAFTIHGRSGLIFAAAIAALSVVVYGIMFVSIPLFSRAQAALDRVLGAARENLTGVRVIRAFCREEDEIRAFDAKNEALTRMNLLVGRLSALMNPVTYVMVNAAAVVLIRTGAVEVNSGGMGQGELVALYNYMAQMIVELIKLASLIITINRAIACAGRVSSVLAAEPGMEFPASEFSSGEFSPGEFSTGEFSSAEFPSTEIRSAEVLPAGEAAEAAEGAASPAARTSGVEEPAVRFRNVTFSYQGAGAPALTDISFEAGRGETVGIIGGTGSGKSTLVQLIPRFYDVTEGAVELGGKDVRRCGKKELRSRIGLVPQKAVLFKGSIRENLRWADPDAPDSALRSALKTAQALDFVESREGGLDSLIEQSGRNLSGGQRQRLTIARALVGQPDILILDDSASALDYATDARLRQALKELPGEMTVFLVSQRTASLRGADQILVLDDGRLTGRGTHEELMQSCPVYQEIHYSQFPEERPESGI